MEMVPSKLMVLLLALGGVGGNELLQYLPTEAYWKIKGVAVSADAMLAELAPPKAPDVEAFVRQLGSERFDERERAAQEIRKAGPTALPALRKAQDSGDAEVRSRAGQLIGEISAQSRAGSVRRLMAIRALGELKARNAESALRDLLGSGDPFVAEYARAALAAIQGASAAPPAPPHDAIRGDLALLPPGCGAVGQMTLPPGKPVDQARLLKVLADFPMTKGEKPERLLEEATRMAAGLAERIGNVRLDAVTVGVAREIGGRSGFVVLIARGRYDAQGMRDLIRGEVRRETRTVEGIEVLPIDREFALMLPSDDRLILAGGPAQDQLPVESLARAARAGAQPKMDPDVADLAKAVDATKPLWISVRVSDTYRQVPILAPFDSVTLTGAPAGANQELLLTAKGKDPAAVKGVVEMFEKGLQEGREAIRREVKKVDVPALRSIADLMDSVKVKTDGGQVTVTGSMPADGGALGIMPMWLFLSAGAPTRAR
jgi:hypothetical protein